MPALNYLREEVHSKMSKGHAIDIEKKIAVMK